jgi:hypothetical protein
LYVTLGSWPSSSRREGIEIGRELSSVYMTSKQEASSAHFFKQLVKSIKQWSSGSISLAEPSSPMPTQTATHREAAVPLRELAVEL